MGENYSILVGTTGAGLFHSPDSGESWSRIGAPIPGESQVRALAVDPRSPNVVYAGANNGIYRSEDAGSSWVKMDSPMEGMNIWSIAVDPADSNTIFVGTSPPFLFRTRDGGKNWEKLSATIAQECAIGAPRVTALLVDPVDRGTVLAGVEIDGVYRSRDGGDTWSHVDSGITNPDIHGMAFSLGEQKTVLVSTPREIFASRDDGETFQSLAVTTSFPMPYCRWVAVKPDNPGGDVRRQWGCSHRQYRHHPALHRWRAVLGDQTLASGTQLAGVELCHPPRQSGPYTGQQLVRRTCTAAPTAGKTGRKSRRNLPRYGRWPGLPTDAPSHSLYHDAGSGSLDKHRNYVLLLYT